MRYLNDRDLAAKLVDTDTRDLPDGALRDGGADLADWVRATVDRLRRIGYDFAADRDPWAAVEILVDAARWYGLFGADQDTVSLILPEHDMCALAAIATLPDPARHLLTVRFAGLGAESPPSGHRRYTSGEPARCAGSPSPRPEVSP